MIRVGITGQSGFIGTHLFNTLGLYPEVFERIMFEDDFFTDDAGLRKFVKKCDAIIHLAALNRHNDPEEIFSTNISLVKQLISACDSTNSKPHILFSSSTQEERDNPYGKSKREGRFLFEEWASRAGSQFTGFIIPNVFGPFGNPYYNSVIATFCHQLTHNELPKIDVNAEISLIYVGELVQEFTRHIKEKYSSREEKKRVEIVRVPHTARISVAELSRVLTNYRDNYFERGEIPSLDDPFHRNLFNTFITYVDHSSFYPFKLKKNTDERGSFVETIRLSSGGQVSFSTTHKGVTRGNHFHTRKAERFAVVSGKALIELRRIGTNKKLSFILDGTEPSFVDMPVWFTHNITNAGQEDVYTIFWISEHYDADDHDTFYEKV